MCDAKPGLRCSSGALKKIAAAQPRFDKAKAAHEQAHAEWQAALNNPGTDSAAVRDLHVAAYDAMLKSNAARDNLLEAEREYELTDEGRQRLVAEAARRHADGDARGAATLRATIEQRDKERRLRAEAFDASKRIKARLAAPTPGEQALLDQSQAARDDAARAADAAEAEYERLKAELAEADRVYAVEVAKIRAAKDHVRQYDDLAKRQAAAAADAAAQVYAEAGVAPRMAKFYVKDMVDGSADAGGVPAGALRFKTKMKGPDVDATKRAAAAVREAEKLPVHLDRDDGTAAERYVRANARLALAASQRHEEAAAAARVRFPGHEPAREQSVQARQQASVARYAAEDARTAADKAEAANRRVRAQVGAGAGIRAKQVSWHAAVGEVRRNPDGTLNAYVYREPSPGLPDGRYVRATGVTTITAAGSGSALRLENGTTAAYQETWRRAANGGDFVSDPGGGVLITPAAEGSTSIADELEFKSFTVVHDSSG